MVIVAMRLFVAGLCNLETTVKVQSFPLEYQSVRYPFFGIGSAPSGVGWNLCAALSALGASVQFCSFIGADTLGLAVQNQLVQYNVKLWLESVPAQTAQEALRRFANIQTIVIGMGERGAWLFERGQAAHLESSIPNPNMQSTVGAGDALFSSFAYRHRRLANARAALAYAVRFASHKLGFVGGATGFLSADELLAP
jgi:sugar/nucleoside kinase (ribokinase family)